MSRLKGIFSFWLQLSDDLADRLLGVTTQREAMEGDATADGALSNDDDDDDDGDQLVKDVDSKSNKAKSSSSSNIPSARRRCKNMLYSKLAFPCLTSAFDICFIPNDQLGSVCAWLGK